MYACNQYVDDQAPWALKKTDPERMAQVLQTLFIAIRDLTLAIQPVVPTKAAGILDQLGVHKSRRSYGDLADEGWFGALVAEGHRIDKPTPAFPRLDLPEEEPAA